MRRCAQARNIRPLTSVKLKVMKTIYIQTYGKTIGSSRIARTVTLGCRLARRDLTVFHMNDAIGLSRKFFIVRDDDEGDPARTI